MRKSNVSKILVAILAFSLLLGAVVGITAAATEEGESTVYLENSQIERNVEYASKAYLLYRVAQSAIAEEDRAGLALQVADVEGNVIGKVAPKLEDGYYVFKSSGVPAKELNTKEVVTVMSGDKAISNAISWSVEEYLYARLYADKYADETEAGVTGIGEDDGKDFIRRELYYDLLKVGANAQEVLAPDAEDKIGDAAFVSASDALATYGRFDEPTEITLRYDPTKAPEGEDFIGWEYAMYDSFGDLVKEGYAADGSVICAEGYIKAKPISSGDYYEHLYVDFDDSAEIPTDFVQFSATEGYATASVSDGKFVLNQHTSGKNNYWYASTTTKNSNANATVFEADFSVNITSGSEVGYLSVYTGAKNSGTQVYWAYMKKSGDYVQITNEYAYTNSVRATNAVTVTTPIKTDGTPCKLRIVYRETEWGEDYLEFYADGKFFHASKYFYATGYNDNKQGPDASDINCVSMNFPSGTVGTMTLDNVVLTQCVLPDYERVGLDKSVIDYDISAKAASQATTPTDKKQYIRTFDEKTGNGYLLLKKYDNTSGFAVDVPVTYTEENANYAVLSFDYYLEDTVTDLSNQIYAAHKTSGGYGNATTPILATLGSFSAHKGKWIHVELTYEVLATDPDTGSVTKVLTQATVTNGPSLRINADETTGVYKNGGTKFKIFNAANTMEVPKAAELTGFRISLNQAAYGDVRFDNLSLKLINKPSN